jgi:hypothetical protein
MRFTDGKEKLEIEIHEGQHSWDTTVEFFDHLTTPILNGTRQLTSSPRFKPGDSSHRFAVGEVLVSKRLPRIRV